VPLKIDLNGKRFGQLKVLEAAGKDAWGQIRWRLLCDCGREHFAVGGKLRRGEVKSCGCAKPAMCAAANVTHGASARGRMTSEYHTWQDMIYRCENPRATQYKDWGGRGIKVSPDWRHDFARFLADMGPRPSPKHTIERLDNDGNYEKGNCCWATRAVQGRNKRNLRMLTVGGTTMPLIAWSEKTGLSSSLILHRLSAGWSVQQALATPLHRLRLAHGLSKA
jgi:hypothetical protein